jgi:hypothetical protein
MSEKNNMVYNNSKQNLNLNTSGISTSTDPDEQFILDIIKQTKQESIQNLIDMLRLQESKSSLLIRTLERYKDQIAGKNELLDNTSLNK